MECQCIASEILQDSSIILREKPYEILQFRRHNRAIIKSQRERTYYLDGIKVAANRKKRMDQKYDSLADWYEEMCAKHDIETADAMRSRLTVKKSQRYYNNLNRVLPGAVFVFEGKRYVMTGQHCGGRYYYAYDKGKKEYPSKRCRILKMSGLIYA